jgi:hypothetical protein
VMPRVAVGEALPMEASPAAPARSSTRSKRRVALGMMRRDSFFTELHP